MISKIRSRTYRLLHARGLEAEDFKMVLDQVAGAALEAGHQGHGPGSFWKFTK